ncbi:MAG: type II toxin-antitoxin system VapC family toxin [Terrimicrobiaceae bacterium]
MYIDSAIIVKLLAKEELSDFFQDELSESVLYTSELSLVEVGSALLSKVRTKSISEKQRLIARELFHQKIADEQIVILPLDSPVYSKARSLVEFCHPTVALRTLDAIHLAACDISQEFPLCATDSRMRAAAATLGIPVFPESLPS